MDYQRIYDDIIDSRRDAVPEGYSERHHVVPRAFGGTDDPSNIVRLTAREHFLCHWLLTKIHPTGRLHYKAMHAFVAMVWQHSENQERYRCTSRLYEKLKKQHSALMSRSQQGNKNSQYGTMWINDGTVSKKVPVGTEIKEGWNIGRVKVAKTPKEKKGNARAMLGKKHSAEAIEKIRLSKLGKTRSTIECPHCGRSCDHGNAKKWHFANCKALVA